MVFYLMEGRDSKILMSFWMSDMRERKELNLAWAPGKMELKFIEMERLQRDYQKLIFWCVKFGMPVEQPSVISSKQLQT